ncbi:hypothetical protein KI387_002215, partial [Taxus chinensis]
KLQRNTNFSVQNSPGSNPSETTDLNLLFAAGSFALDRWYRAIEKLLLSRKYADQLLLGCTSLAVMVSVLTCDVDSANAFVVTPPRKLQTDELATVRLFQDNTPSVVYITNLAVRQDAFTLDVLEVPQGSGSGFIWDQRGHIVTNYHVIRGASDLRASPSAFVHPSDINFIAMEEK